MAAWAADSPAAIKSLVRREIVPDEGLHVGLDDDVGLRAPGEIGVALDDRERAADHVGGGARGGEAAGFEVDGDGDVGAEQAGAFDGDGRGEEAVDEGAAFELNGNEQPRIGAGAAKRRADAVRACSRRRRRR